MHSPPQPFDSPQRRPTHDGVHAQWSGEPLQVSPVPVHAVPGVHVPPHPSLGALPHGRVDGGVQVGAQQPVPVQRWPAGHIVPFGHAAQPAGSVGLKLHMSELAAAHAGQHEPPVQLDPLAHIVPVPHVRQTAPVESC
jgi:hypothetical protein